MKINEQTRLSIAPMMDWTDRHCRYFLRLITRRALLYSEMVTSGAIIHGDSARFLAFDPAEHPVALQLGGADPHDLATAARAGADAGFDEINLNVGCPSDRVQRGRFGACLMAEPDLVADCVKAMADAVAQPITVKTRIGVDDLDSYELLMAFTEKMARAGAGRLIVHARKAWLQGLSPKQNRDIPPLDYPRVYRLKHDFPEMTMVINGGLQDLDTAAAQLDHVDGVMLGRVAYQNPYVLADADRRFFDDERAPLSREEVVLAFLPYVEAQLSAGVPLKSMTRHILGLFNGIPQARLWRRHLSEEAHKPGAGPEVIEAALNRWRAAQNQEAA